MRKEQLAMKIVLSCVCAGSVLIPCWGAEAPSSKDWPCWRGADGSGWMPCATPLIRDMSKIKLVWESEEKQMPSSYGPIMGGAGGPVIADGKVFFYYSWPGGEVDQSYFNALKEQADKMATGGKAKWLKSQYEDMGISLEEYMRIKSRHQADDVVIAVDLKTGKTLWKQIFPNRSKSISAGGPPMFKFVKNGPHIIACAAYGKVTTVGAGGDLYCLDAASGKVVWEKKQFRSVPQKHGICNGSPTFGGGVFVIFQGGKNSGLIGLDSDTGNERWKTDVNLPEKAMPIRWVHAGQEYIIAGTSCIEPKTGKVMWTAAGAVQTDGTPAIQGDLIVFGGDHPSGDQAVTGGAGMNCFRMTPQGAEKIWSLDRNYTAGWITPAIINGVIYTKCRGKDWKSGSRGAIVGVDLATGKALGQIATGSDTAGSMIGIGDLLQLDGAWYDANPQSFKSLGDAPEPAGDYRPTFSSSHTPSPAGGSLIIIRGRNSLRCYDLGAK